MLEVGIMLKYKGVRRVQRLASESILCDLVNDINCVFS